MDYSEEKMLELYISESYGDVTCSDNNGYALGKKWLSVTVAMWKEDIESNLLLKRELYDDPELPNWWLDRIFR